MLDRLSYRLYRLATGLRRRFERRFTRAGLLLMIGVMLTGAMAANPDLAVAYQTFAFLVCLLCVSMAGAVVFRGRFTARRDLPRFGTVGEPMPYQIVVRNDTRRIQRGLEVMEDLADRRPSLAEYIESVRSPGSHRSFRLVLPPRHRAAHTPIHALPPLVPGQDGRVAATLTPLKRGSLRFLGVTVARPDPLGLCRALRRVSLPQTVLVLPRRYPLPPFALPGTMKYQQGGVALAASVGESEEFVSLREYRRGDPLRRVHWRSWARLGKPIVKEFQDEFFVRHALVLDTFAPAGQPEVFEEAVSLAASFACTIQTQESLLDLMFVGPQAYCFTSGRGLAHTEQMLEILASVQVCRDRPFRTLTNLVLEHAATLSGCICLFVAWDEPRQELVRLLSTLAVPVRVLVVTGPGSTARLPAGPMSDEPQNFSVLQAGKIEEGLVRGFPPGAA